MNLPSNSTTPLPHPSSVPLARRIYLSTEPSLAGGGSVILLDYPTATHLQPGEGYSRSLPISVPHDFGAGPAYFIVRLDDTSYSPAGSELAVEVMLTTGTLPDLAASAASGPASAATGETIALNWSATNVGEEDVLGVWNDRVGLYNPSNGGFTGSTKPSMNPSLLRIFAISVLSRERGKISWA